MLIIHFPETKLGTFVHCRVLIILVAVSHAAVCHKFDVNRGTLLACKASVCAAYACLRKYLIPVSLLFCKAFDSIVCSPFRKACPKASFCLDSTGKASLSVRISLGICSLLQCLGRRDLSFKLSDVPSYRLRQRYIERSDVLYLIAASVTGHLYENFTAP